MHYNWKRYMKQQCPECGWMLARKREEITEDSPSICCHCKTLMEDITPPKPELVIDMETRAKLIRSIYEKENS